MNELTEYVIQNTERGDCICGKCCDSPTNPQQPSGCTANMIFFNVKAKSTANSSTLREMIQKHKGEWNHVDLFDGKEHNYIEIGGWVGDQGAALMLMGLGTLLGLWIY